MYNCMYKGERGREREREIERDSQTCFSQTPSKTKRTGRDGANMILYYS